MALEPGDERQRRLRLYAVTLAIVGLSALAAVSVLWTAPRIEDGIEDRARARLRLNEVAVDDLLVVANGRNGKWELYDLKADRTEMNDLAEQEPARVKELAAKWEAYAQRANVYPLAPYFDKKKSSD